MKGYYQPVKFESRHLVEQESSAALVRDGKAEPLTLGEDAIFSTRVDLAPEVDAPLVFVGYGLSIPEKDFDDLAGLDLKGKVAVLISGSPSQIPSALAAHHQTAGERWKALRKAGAVGIISIPNPASMDVPWSRIALNRLHPSMELAGASLTKPKARSWRSLSIRRTRTNCLPVRAILSRSLRNWRKIAKPLPHFPLTVSIQAKAKVKKKAVESANLVAAAAGERSAVEK